MFPRVVQYGDGSDETRTRTSTGSDDSCDDAAPCSAGERLPAPLQYRDPARYEIVAEHGRGGLGRVFRARDKELGRDVALKELLSRGSTTELRFFREALITARLEHPGIVPVHEAGRWPDGTPFYAMKLVAGRPLKALIDECKTLEDRLALLPHVIAVADAIAYAHDRKIIHRDLKPSNIIVGDFGETVVIDWGLAKDISDQAPADDPVEDGPYRTAVPANDGVTVAGTIVGTPAYMSPEQSRGDLVDERTDVYAIGRVLVSVLTGDSAISSTRSRSVPRDLLAIAAMATQPHPASRYASARELAADLRGFQLRVPVNARRYGPFDRIALVVSRNRAIAATIAVALVVGLALAGIAIAELSRQRRDAVHAREVAHRAERDAIAGKDQLLLQHAESLLQEDPTRAFALVRSFDGADQARATLTRSLALAYGVAEQDDVSHFDTIRLVAQTPDGRILSVGEDRRVLLGDLGRAREQIAALPETRSAIAISPDGKYFAHDTGHGVRVHDLATGRTGDVAFAREVIQLEWCSTSTLVAASTDGAIARFDVAVPDGTVRNAHTWRLSPAPTYLVCEPGDNVLVVWDSEDRVARLDASSTSAFAIDARLRAPIALNSNEVALALATRDGVIVVGPNSHRRHVRSPCVSAIADVAIDTHDGIAVACDDGAVYWLGANDAQLLFRAATRPRLFRLDRVGRYLFHFSDEALYFDLSLRTLRSLRGHDAPVSAVSHSRVAPGRHFTGDQSGHIRSWALSPPPVTSFELPGAAANVRYLDARTVATDSRIGISWIGTSTGPIELRRTHATSSFGVSPAPGGRGFATVGDGGLVVVYDRSSDEPISYRGQRGLVDVAFLDDGTLVSGGEEGIVQLRPARSAADVPATIISKEMAAIHFLITTARQRIVIFTADRTLSVFDRTGARLVRHSFSNDATAFTHSPNGSLIAFGDDTGVIRVLDGESFKIIATFRTDRPARYMNLADAGLLSVVTEDGDAHLYSARHAQPPWTRLRMDATWTRISPTGDRIAFASRAGYVCVYHLHEASWSCVVTGAASLASLVFSPDGHEIAAVSSDSKIHFLTSLALATNNEQQR